MSSMARRTILNHVGVYVSNLACNALAMILVLSYVPLTKDFVMGRGWRTFTELFGGFGGMVFGFIVMLIVGAVVVIAVNAELPQPHHRWIAGLALAVVIVLAAAFGQSLFAMLFAGNTMFIIGFLALVALESAIEWLFARRRPVRVISST